MAAFYDDSGGFHPNKDKFACFGMVVTPTAYIRKCCDAWWEMLEMHFQCPISLQTTGIEAKSSELFDMLLKLNRGSKLQNAQHKMFEYGLNTPRGVDELIEAVFNFLAKPPIPMKYLAVVVKKEEAWLKFCADQFSSWEILTQAEEKQKVAIRNLHKELESFLIKHTYKYLLQRLQYLSDDAQEPFEFSDAFIIGDQSSVTKTMLEIQTNTQAGLEKFSELPTIINKSWFGFSLYDPCLQMADWIAFAIRVWAEESTAYAYRIKQLLPNFRGYPDDILGRGIVLCPSGEYFPTL